MRREAFLIFDYEWGNMTARVTLDAGPPDDSQQALEEFRENYSMTELD